MTENIGGYGRIIETIHQEGGTRFKIGFREGKWIAKSDYERVAVAKKGFLLHLEYDEYRRARAYNLYLNFDEMAADDVDVFLLSKVAAALDVTDFVAFFD
jgi:hypothetical protein